MYYRVDICRWVLIVFWLTLFYYVYNIMLEGNFGEADSPNAFNTDEVESAMGSGDYGGYKGDNLP